MTEKSAVVLIACWHNNDYAALRLQVKDCVDITFVVVTLGDSSVPTEEGYNILSWDHDVLLNYLSVHKISALPYCVIADSAGKSVEDYSLLMDGPLVEADVDYFARGIEDYNNFDIFNAVKWFSLSLVKEPTNLKALFNMASILHMCGYPMLSIPYVETLLILSPDDITAHSFLWALSADPLCTSVCVDTYRRLAAAGDLRAITKLATLTGEGSAAARGDPSYAKQIYDDMAEKFEGKLVDCLGYKGPWLMLEMLEKLGKGGSGVIMPAVKGDWRVLDVGCGSGLCGRVFSDYFLVDSNAETGLHSLSEALDRKGPVMIGIDISQKMVDIALEKGGYHYGEAGDLSAVLSSITQHSASPGVLPSALLDMVIAADTFIYVGALGDVFASVRQVLKPHGLLLFSTEDLDSSPMKVQLTAQVDDSNTTAVADSNQNEIAGAVPGWGCQLLKSARFAHSQGYIEALCVKHCFKIVSQMNIVLRTEETIPLNGNLYIVQV